MSGLRFCMVTTFYPPHNFGGDGIGVQRLARALVQRGHQVTVICDNDAYNVLHHGPPPERSRNGDGVVVHRLQSRVARLAVLFMQQTGRPGVHGRSLHRLLDSGNFDVINYHNVSLAGGPEILSAGEGGSAGNADGWRGVKLYTAWEHWLVCPTHVLWRHGREPCDARECLRCVLHYKRPPQLWRYTGYLDRQARHVDAFIALSEFSRDKHHEFGFSREMEVIPGFLPDPVDTVPAPNSAPHHRPYFFFAGRLERLKGLDDVIPVFSSYVDADLLIAGDGTHRHELERIASGNPRVKFLGLVPTEELAAYYRHAIAGIVPSVGYETFGFVVIEAFHHGTPVIARRSGPLPELVATSGGGSVFETPEELAATMHRMQSDAVWRSQLGRAAYEGFVRHWTEGAVLPRYFDLIRRIATAKGRFDICAELDA